MATGKLNYPPFREQVALGIVPGWESFRKFGVNDSVSSNSSREDVWNVAGVRVLPGSAGALTVASSSAEDDPDDGVDAGTGAWTIIVQGLDSNYNEIQEEIELNGTANVASASSDWFRVNRAFVGSLTGAASAGTGGVNAGTISVTLGGNVQCQIAANEGQTANSQYTVPAGKTLLVTTYKVQCGRMAGSSDLHVEAEINLFGTNAWRSISNVYLWDGQNWSNTESVTAIPEKTELRVQTVSSTTTQMAAVYGGYLVSNGTLANY